MENLGYKVFTVIGLISMFVIKWTIQLEVLEYGYLGHSDGMFLIMIEDIALVTIFPSIIHIVAVLLTSKKIASMVLSIINIVSTIFVLVYNWLFYAVLYADTGFSVSRWLFLINLVPLTLTIIHIVKLNRKKKSGGLVSYDI